MSHFEFILIPFSIVAALAISELMHSWARIIKSWEKVNHPFLYISFSAGMVTLLLMHWTGLWPYRDLVFNLSYVLIVFIPTLVFTTALLVFSAPSDALEDLEAHYFVVIKKTAPLLIVAAPLAMLIDVIHERTYALAVALGVSAVLLMFGPLLTRSRSAHLFGHAVMWAFIGFSVFSSQVV